jgi:fermentation-respiration switch protein FrsA (DUF1100 family)
MADHVPALIWRGGGSDARPAIITIHGGGGSKRDIEARTVELVTSRGVTLVSIDVYLHGEHVPPDFDRRSLGTTSLALFLEIYEHTARDLFTVTEHLRNDPEIDAGRIGLRGGSMGGYIVLAGMGMNVPVRAGLSICGAADYATAFRHRLERLNVEPGDMTRQLEGVEDRIRQVDPLFHLDAFALRPIMMIHGARDPLVPIEGHRALYDALVPYYRNQPQDCLFLTHAGGHETPPTIEDLGWEWLISSLLDRETA